MEEEEGKEVLEEEEEESAPLAKSWLRRCSYSHVFFIV
jgi:hypothetical protein